LSLSGADHSHLLVKPLFFEDLPGVHAMSSSAAEPSPLAPQQVADMLDTLAAADQQVAQILDRISASRSPVSRATVNALERLLATLRPAADVRARLTGVDRRVLDAGIRLRRERHDALRPLGSVVIGELQ
jgi:hypothetical protein